MCLCMYACVGMCVYVVHLYVCLGVCVWGVCVCVCGWVGDVGGNAHAFCDT